MEEVTQLGSTGLCKWFVCSVFWPESVSRNLGQCRQMVLEDSVPASPLVSELLVTLFSTLAPFHALGLSTSAVTLREELGER